MTGTTTSTPSGSQPLRHLEPGLGTTDRLPQPAVDSAGVDLQRLPVPKLAARRRWPGLQVDPLGAIGVLLLIAGWQLLTFLVPVAALPAPWDVVKRIGDDFWAAPELSFYGLDTGLAGSLVYTATNVLMAVLAGSVLGVAGGLLTGRIGLLRQIADPFMMTVGTIPILVLAPFFLIWFGVGRASALLLVVFYVTVMLYVYAQRATFNLSPIHEDAARTLGASKAQILRDVVLPATVPEVLAGIRVALAGAWGLEAITELLGAQAGMGKMIQVLAGATDVQGIFAALLMLGVAAIVCDALAAWAVGLVTAWHKPIHPNA
jgi:ABC-type nitrate/sulfonate/bicarbonate transport system permease component